MRNYKWTYLFLLNMMKNFEGSVENLFLLYYLQVEFWTLGLVSLILGICS